jgi:hypothetical protein
MRNMLVNRAYSTRLRFAKRLWCAVAVIAAVGVAAGCTQRIAGNPLPVPQSSAGNDVESEETVPSTYTPGSSGATPDSGSPADESSAPGSSSGPNGAPFDPCRIVGWEDVPVEKPQDEAKAEPHPQSPQPDDDVFAACLFTGVHNDIAVCGGRRESRR